MASSWRWSKWGGIAEKRTHNKKCNHFSTRIFPSSIWVLYSAFFYWPRRDGCSWNIFVCNLLLEFTINIKHAVTRNVHPCLHRILSSQHNLDFQQSFPSKLAIKKEKEFQELCCNSYADWKWKVKTSKVSYWFLLLIHCLTFTNHFICSSMLEKQDFALTDALWTWNSKWSRKISHSNLFYSWENWFRDVRSLV